MPRLALYVLGAPRLERDGVPVRVRRRKVMALLVYLAMTGERYTRDALATMFWPDEDQSHARGALRRALSELNQIIGEKVTQAGEDTVSLAGRANFWSDAYEFHRRWVVAQTHPHSTDLPCVECFNSLTEAAQLYQADFLAGFTLSDSAGFDEWLCLETESLRIELTRVLKQLVSLHQARQETDQAIRIARRWQELDPLDESAHRFLMQFYAASGQRYAALRQYQECTRILASELGIKPAEETTQLYQLICSQVGGNDEPLAEVVDQQHFASSRRLNNLPAALTSFIGRHKEQAELIQLLQTGSVRLVTITGAGGMGKTRLALQTANELVEQFADGVWLVELASASDPALVPIIAAHALGLREQSSSQTLALMQEYLEPKHMLLILDNCEHLIDACAPLAGTLLQFCPTLTILTTSREALGISGEVIFRVPPMTLPPFGVTLVSPPFEALTQYEAIHLFIERAATASPGFALTQANAPAILQACWRLDGIPLAIELAAARVKLLQVEEIVQRLDDRFRLLTGGSREALPRYQTLRASIDWSYDLLPESERTLLQCLSVFAGGWVLEAAEAVGCGKGIQSCDVLELLGHLVDKSLVQTVSSTDGLNRFRMLETIRQYAHEKLVAAGQTGAVRDRHLHYYLDLAEEVEWKLRGPDPAHILERLEAELDNLRLALAWSLEGRGRPGWNPEPGLRLVTALKFYWLIGGHPDEGIQWLDLFLAGEVEERAVRSERGARLLGTRQLTPERTRRRAKALQATAWLAYYCNEHTKAGRLSAESRALYQSLGADGRVGYAYTYTYFLQWSKTAEEVRILEQALAIFREAGDRFGTGEILISLGIIALSSNEYQKAKAYFDENLALRKEIGDMDGLGGALRDQSSLAYYKGDFKQARALLMESMGVFSAIHYYYTVGWCILWLGQIEMVDGDYAQAAAYACEALSTGRRKGDTSLTHFSFIYLGRLALIQGNYLQAAEWFEQSLAYCRKQNHKAFIVNPLYFLGLLAWQQGECDRASTLYAEALINVQEMSNELLEGFTLYQLGKISFARGESHQALANFKQALETPVMWLGNPLLFRNVDLTMLALEGITALATAHGFAEDAARLLGATEAWHKIYVYIRLPRERQEREECITALRSAMGEQAFTAAWAEGKALSLEQTVAKALSFAERES